MSDKKSIISQNYELRFVSKNPAANGETDFKGESSTLSTDDRIEYLKVFANELSKEFGDFSLDREIVTLDEARERLKSIKPRPENAVRKRVELGSCRYLSHIDGSDTRKRIRITEKRTAIPKQDFRTKLIWSLNESADIKDSEFELGKAVHFGFDDNRNFYSVSDGKREAFAIEKVPREITLEVDFVSGRYNIYIDNIIYLSSWYLSVVFYRRREV